MSLEAKLFTALTGATSITATVPASNIFAVRAKENQRLPYIVYRRISGNQINGLSGYQNAENPRIQLDAYSTSALQAISIKENIHSVLNTTTTFRALLMSDEDTFEQDLDVYKGYRRTMDFSFINLE